VLPPSEEVNLLFHNGPGINYFRSCGDKIPVSTTVSAEGRIQESPKGKYKQGNATVP
jgi:hypothetical protein